MYLIGIDISKYKHDCYIATIAEGKIKSFSFDNNSKGFNVFLNELLSLNQSLEIRIGLESTGHYGSNLKQFITTNGFTYLEFNPYLTHMFSQALSLRKTKTDKIDAKMISSMLGSVDYKTLHTKLYHNNELKSLIRYRDSQILAKSKLLIQLTNLLDRTFPEFKSFFNNRLVNSPMFILEKFKSRKRIASFQKKDYESLRSYSKGKFSFARFIKLKELALSSIGYETKIDTLIMLDIIKQHRLITDSISSIENTIIKIMESFDEQTSSIPGISVITAAVIHAEIGDFKNFSNPAKVISFSGLDNSISQSGQMDHSGHLVKRGSGLLRKAFWQAAFSTLKYIPSFYEYYRKKRLEGMHHKVALTQLTRKLVRMVYHLNSSDIPFDYSQCK